MFPVVWVIWVQAMHSSKSDTDLHKDVEEPTYWLGTVWFTRKLFSLLLANHTNQTKYLQQVFGFYCTWYVGILLCECLKMLLGVPMGCRTCATDRGRRLPSYFFIHLVPKFVFIYSIPSIIWDGFSLAVLHHGCGRTCWKRWTALSATCAWEIQR